MVGGRREKEGGTRDPNANFIELRRVIMSKCIFYCRLVSTRDVNYSRAAIFTSGFAVNAQPSPDTRRFQLSTRKTRFRWTSSGNAITISR